LFSEQADICLINETNNKINKNENQIEKANPSKQLFFFLKVLKETASLK
jgi:hypothetical protein